MATPRATAFTSASAGVCLVLLGIVVAQMILMLPLSTWWRGVIIGIVLTSIVGWLARSTTISEGPSAPFEPNKVPSWRPRDRRMCRKHRIGPAQPELHCGPSSGDPISPWFQLW